VVQSAIDASADPSGNVFLLIRNDPNGPNPSERLMKMSPTGATIWSKELLIGDGQDWISTAQIATDKLGNVALTGRASTSGASGGFLSKFNGAGVALWTKRFNDVVGRDYHPLDVQFDHTNQVVIAGFSRVNGAQRMMLHRYGLNGELRFQRYYANASYNDNFAQFLTIDPVGNIYVGGASTNLSNRLQPFFWSYSPSGTLRYARSLVITRLVYSFGGAVSADGKFVIGLGPVQNGVPTIGAIQLNADGSTAWLKTKAATGTFYGGAIALAPNGNVVLGGSHSTNGNEDDYWRTMVIGPTGTILRDAVLVGASESSQDYVKGAFFDGASNLYLAGEASYGGPQTGRLQQFLPTGDLGWNTRLTASQSVYHKGLVTDAFGSVIGFGFAWVGSNPTAFVAKLGNLNSVSGPAGNLAPGATRTLKVTLAMAARTGGVRVSLSSNSARLIVPASVLVPAGTTEATFVARATAGGAADAVVTAQIPGVPRTLNIAIRP
jgi:hypothetical protein